MVPQVQGNLAGSAYLFQVWMQVNDVDKNAEDDTRLLQKALAGDENSFARLYTRHGASLFRFAWRLTRSVQIAEDVVQECWLVVLERRGFRRERGSVRGYLFGIARNLAFRRLRIGMREQEPALEPETGSGPFEALLTLEKSEAVAQAIAILPLLQREALILFEYEELSLDEIAHATAADVGTIKARLHRARATLRRTLAPLISGCPPKGDGGERKRLAEIPAP